MNYPAPINSAEFDAMMADLEREFPINGTTELKLPLPKHPSMPNHSITEPKPRQQFRSAPLKFSELQVGDYFIDDGTVYEKLDDTLARGPKRHALGSGIYDGWEADDEVEAC